jgi:hypothetical protein
LRTQNVLAHGTPPCSPCTEKCATCAGGFGLGGGGTISSRRSTAAAERQLVPFLLEVSLCRAARRRHHAPKTSSTSALDALTENVHMREASEYVSGVQR